MHVLRWHCGFNFVCVYILGLNSYAPIDVLPRPWVSVSLYRGNQPELGILLYKTILNINSLPFQRVMGYSYLLLKYYILRSNKYAIGNIIIT